MSLFLFPNECATSYCSRHHWLTLCICCFKLLNNRSPCSLALHCLSYGVVLSPTKDLCTAARTAPSSSYATHIFFLLACDQGSLCVCIFIIAHMHHVFIVFFFFNITIAKILRRRRSDLEHQLNHDIRKSRIHIKYT